MKSLLIRNLAQVATPVGFAARKGEAMGDIRLYTDAAIWIKDGRIWEVGDSQELTQRAVASDEELKVIDAQSQCAVPGFVDPHTHFLFGGARAEEFDARLRGVPYMELLARGGGIVSTMQHTRQASEKELLRIGMNTLSSMLSLGYTTIEGKSGYGLDLKTELKLLKVMGQLQEKQPVDIVRTYLGAHAVPPEYKGRSGEYIQWIIDEVLPVIKKEKLAEFVDVFCEKGVFTNEESERLLAVAKYMGFAIKLHADEMTSTGGTGLGCTLGAVSADHLLAISDADIARLGAGDTVAVLLPATAFCMRKAFAPARRLLEAGAAVALASDFNPGSCYTYSLPLIFGLAVIAMNMTAAEALTACTLNAAAAINRADFIGSIEKGKQGDIVLLDVPDYRYLSYKTGINLVKTVIKNGEIVHVN